MRVKLKYRCYIKAVVIWKCEASECTAGQGGGRLSSSSHCEACREGGFLLGIERSGRTLGTELRIMNHCSAKGEIKAVERIMSLQ